MLSQDCTRGSLVGKWENVWSVTYLSSTERSCTSTTDTHEDSKAAAPQITLRWYISTATSKYTAEKHPMGCKSNWCWIVSDSLEPYALKGACTVLRGLGDSNIPRLPGGKQVHAVNPAFTSQKRSGPTCGVIVAKGIVRE
jgi:hypothetical protein